MSNKNTGGPAFPSLNSECTGIDSEGRERFSIEPSGGMTLRDYFAAKAMQGVFTNPIPCSDDERRYIAEKSYKMADAMLKAREA